MPRTRMDSRAEAIERNLALLEDGFTKLKVDNEQVTSKLSSIESLLHTLAKGKTITNEVKSLLNLLLAASHPPCTLLLLYLFISCSDGKETGHSYLQSRGPSGVVGSGRVIL